MDNLHRFQNKTLSKLIIEFSLPATIGMIVSFSYNIVDRIFVGNQIGAGALSGVAVLFPVQIIIFGLAFMIGIGANTNVSINLGKKNLQEAEHYLTNAFSIAIIISIVIFAILHIFFDQILDLVGSYGNIRQYSSDFLYVVSFGVLFQTVSFSLNNLIRAAGFPQTAMWTQIIGAMINIILDAIFIYKLGWGVKGAALATNIGSFISMAWVVAFFISKRSPIKFKIKYLMPKFAIVSSIVAIGIGSFLTQISGSVITLLLNRLLYKYGGPDGIAVLSIATGIEAFMFVPIIGLSIGLRPIIGYNFGAKDFTRVRRSLEIGIFTTLSVGVLGFAIIQLFAPNLISLFVPNNQHIIEMGVTALRTFTFFITLVGLEITATTYFQSIGNAKIALILTLNRQLIFLLPLMFILPLYFGLMGLWYAGAVSDFASSILSASFLFWAMKTIKKKEVEPIPEAAIE